MLTKLDFSSGSTFLEDPLTSSLAPAFQSFERGLDDQLLPNSTLLGSSSVLPTVTPDPGSGSGQAYNAGTLNGNRTFSDFVGSTDTNDYYQFNLSAPGSLSILLNGLSADADLQLLNGADNVIGGSSYSGTTADSINLSGLAAGSYYVRVYQYSGNTNYNLSVTADYAGNTQSASRNIGSLSGTQTLKDFVDNTDTNDYYQFNLSAPGSFNVSLNDLSADANLQVLNSGGTIIGSSSNTGTTADSINFSSLAAGSYYVRVYQYSGNTNYNLSLTADYAGNTQSASRNIGTLSDTQTLRDFVGSTDTNDYYQFNLSNPGSLSILLNGLSADADLQLLNSANTVIGGSSYSGTTADSINLSGLAAGTYYVRVYQYSGNTNYNLSLTADYAGNTQSAPRNIGSLSGTQTFKDFVGSADTNDFYSFSLGATTNFNLSVTGLNADADVRLRDSTGAIITYSNFSSNHDESINRTLNAGNYFVEVYQYSGDTNYTLNLSSASLSQPSNLLAHETDIGNLSGTRSFSEFVGSTDTADVYSFNLNTTSNFILSLTGLSTDADVRLIRDVNGNGIVDSGDEVARSSSASNLNESINLSSLAAGNYFAQVYQYSGDTNYNLSLSATPVGNSATSPLFSSFSITDASGDNTSTTVFQGGALRLSYNLQNAASVSSVQLQAVRNGSVVSTLGTWSGASLSNGLINLASFSSLTAGDYQLRVVAHTTSGQDFFSNAQSLGILTNSRINGTFAADTLEYSAGLGTGAIFLGRGGTDILDLSLAGIDRSNITSINGLSLSALNPLSNSTWNQAIYGGTAFDYITLSDGREIYFQGIEDLRFVDGSIFELQVHPNDTFFGDQWNLAVSDVSSAWRFTQGSSNVLLASLDTGILTVTGGSGGITDISTSRLITDPTDDDNFNDYGHGHSSISVMSSTANNSSGVAGINWNSNVYVNDVYSGVSLQQAITDTINYARAHNMRVIFQGGIQGESWLNSGGTQAQLEQLIQNNSDIALFAVAAGNGGPGGNLSDLNYLTSVSGVARLQTNHSNVISVGALQRTGTATVNGLTNASSVDIASYSNRGSNLTLMAATDSPAMNKLGNMGIFGGTSCANPNMAGIASLVWSVNSTLDAGQVRQILIDTAMDLGTADRDNTFGNGLVNADAAVRRAWALGHNSDVANLYSGNSLFV